MRGVTANRYHLYISYACPWANRCLATLYLKVRFLQASIVFSCCNKLHASILSSVLLSRMIGKTIFQVTTSLAPAVACAVQGLQDVIGLSVCHPTWQRTRPDDPNDEHAGWAFRGPSDPPLTSVSGFGSFDCEGVAGGAAPATGSNANSGSELFGCKAVDG
jgi:hypothetical protein